MSRKRLPHSQLAIHPSRVVNSKGEQQPMEERGKRDRKMWTTGRMTNITRFKDPVYQARKFTQPRVPVSTTANPQSLKKNIKI